jgi:4,5-DOPA dioxygenase extradiol
MNSRMPTLFLSHGSPMYALEPGAAGRAWAKLGRTLPKPRAVLMVSAHWETSVPMLSGNAQPETIHDFGGFPPELYRVTYPARGMPELATRSVTLLKSAGITAGVDGCRGLDHGAWVPLRWMYPDADVPVVQLSVQPQLGPAHHVRLGQALAPLAEDGVLIIGSGHTTHNLRDWVANSRKPEPLAYARAFSAWLAATTPTRWRPTANARRKLRARTRARSISFRCSSHMARPATMRGRTAFSRDSRMARWRWTRTSSRARTRRRTRKTSKRAQRRGVL